MNLLKRCIKCGHEKPATSEFFHVHKRSLDGRRSVCRMCRTLERIESRIGRLPVRGFFKKGDLLWDCGIRRTCTNCKKEFPASTIYFHLNKNGCFGLRPVCRECRKIQVRLHIKKPEIIESRKRLSKKYILSGKNAERNRIWRNKNPEKAKEVAKKYREGNKEKRRLYGLEYRAANRNKIREKQRRADAKLQQKPTHVLKKRLKARLRQMLRGQKLGSSEKLFGFTMMELAAHIEGRFQPDMSWEALLRGEIHIDHIRPVCSFNIKSINDPDFKKCWGLDNLQPLWARDNYLKGTSF